MDRAAHPQPSAQALLLNFFAAYVLDRRGGEPDIPTAAAIEVCRRLGIGEHAVRSTLARMVDRDLLDRQRIGRGAAYRLTARSRTVLREGRRRIDDVGAVRDETQVRWVLLAFNLPAAAQRERHILRARLTWAGFGLLQGGLWIAPAPAALSGLTDDPRLAPHLKIFTADAYIDTDMAALATSIWDLDELASAYNAFTDRWTTRARSAQTATEPLAEQLRLGYEWLELLRRDPRLPQPCLPPDWPAARAQEVFKATRAASAKEAEFVVAELLGQH